MSGGSVLPDLGRRAPPSINMGTFAWPLEHDFIRIITTARLFAEPPYHHNRPLPPRPPEYFENFLNSFDFHGIPVRWTKFAAPSTTDIPMKIFVFAIVFVMPSGELQMSTQVVPSCPAKEKVVEMIIDLKAKGLIKDFRAQCTEFQLQKPLDI